MNDGLALTVCFLSPKKLFSTLHGREVCLILVGRKFLTMSHPIMVPASHLVLNEHRHGTVSICSGQLGFTHLERMDTLLPWRIGHVLTFTVFILALSPMKETEPVPSIKG